MQFCTNRGVSRHQHLLLSCKLSSLATAVAILSCLVQWLYYHASLCILSGGARLEIIPIILVTTAEKKAGHFGCWAMFSDAIRKSENTILCVCVCVVIEGMKSHSCSFPQSGYSIDKT